MPTGIPVSVERPRSVTLLLASHDEPVQLAQVGNELSGMGNVSLNFQEANEFQNTSHEAPRVRGQHLLPPPFHARTVAVVPTKGAEHGVIDGFDDTIAVLKPN